jgi:hypothetical protein
MMRFFLSILLMTCMAACNSSNDNKTVVVKDSVATAPKADSEMHYVHSFTDTALENKITDKLMALPFVKKSDKYIDSFSNHQHGIAFMVDRGGDSSDTEITVEAGYNGDERFETYYHFFVNPKTLEIKVLDVVNDKKLTVKEFMKTQH